MRRDADHVAATGVEEGLSEAFSAEAEEIARLWPQELRRLDPSADAVAPRDASAGVEAVAAALADDLAPLAALLGLDARGGDAQQMPANLDAGLRHLDAIRRATLQRPLVRAHCSEQKIDEAFTVVARQIAVQTAATLAARTAAAEGLVSSSRAAMAVTMHELRRPLTVMSGYTQLLAGGVLGELTERGRGAAQSMVAASEVMQRLTEALAVVARLEDPAEPVELRELDMASVIEAAVDDATTEATLAAVAITTELSGQLRVRGDRARLTVALANLLSNAVKHAPQGTTVEVRGFEADGLAHVAVRDHGGGFPPETAERLFEKYYRDAGERSRGIPGAGLGLFIVLAVAERHRGRAVARNAPGGGAEFELILPALPA
jgi:signal transduction histidine kinase